jgi:hypothetical protein
VWFDRVAGIVVSNFVTAPQSVRIPGVLQRFGVSFLVVALILILVPKNRGEDDGRDEEGDRWLLADITHYIWWADRHSSPAAGCSFSSLRPSLLAAGSHFHRFALGCWLSSRLAGTGW